MGAKCGATRISLGSKLNRRDRVSGMIFNFLPDFCSCQHVGGSSFEYRIHTTRQGVIIDLIREDEPEL